MVQKGNSRSFKIAKAGIAYTVGNFLVKGMAFLSIPIFVRLMSTAEYGNYSTYLAYEGIMTNVIGLALQISIKNAKFKYEDKYHSYISSLLLLEFLSLTVWVGIALFGYSAISKIVGLDRFTLVLLVVHCFSTTILAFYNIYLSMDYSYKSYLYVSLLNAVLNLGVSIVLILTVFNNNRYLGRVIGTVIPVAIIAFAIVLFFWKKSKPVVNIEYWKFGLLFSLPLIPHAISQVVLNQFDRIMINRMVGADSAGIYSFSYNIYLIISVTAASLDNVWCPWFFEQYKNSRFENIKKRSSMYALGMLVFVTLIMLAAPEIIKILGTEQYRDSIYIVVPICAGGYYWFLYSIPVQVEYYLEKTKYIPIGTLLAAGVNVVLNYVFIKKFGYEAAAYTTEFTYFLYFIAQYFIARKISGRSLFSGSIMCFVSIGNFLISLLALWLVPYMAARWCIILLVLFACAPKVIKIMRDRKIGDEK